MRTHTCACAVARPTLTRPHTHIRMYIQTRNQTDDSLTRRRIAGCGGDRPSRRFPIIHVLSSACHTSCPGRVSSGHTRTRTLAHTSTRTYNHTYTLTLTLTLSLIALTSPAHTRTQRQTDDSLTRRRHGGCGGDRPSRRFPILILPPARHTTSPGGVSSRHTLHTHPH